MIVYGFIKYFIVYGFIKYFEISNLLFINLNNIRLLLFMRHLYMK